jgi:DNA-directed RNA polymerase specialized sigma24 family protein
VGVPDREPTPEEVAELTELVTALTARLPPEDRPILELRLLGYSPAEIAEKVGRSPATVFRRLADLWGHVEALWAG